MTASVVLAVLVMALRTGLSIAGHPPEGTDFMLVHLFALTLVPFLAGHAALRRDPLTGFPGLVREGFKSAAAYAILFAMFIWAYYRCIDVTEFPLKVAERVDQAVRDGLSEEEARRRIEGFFTPFNYATMTLLALLAAGAFNALMTALVHHKLLRRFMH